MKKTKRFLGSLLVLGMLSSFVTIANAEGNEADTKAIAPAGVKILTPDEYNNYLNSRTNDELEKINAKIRSAEEVAQAPIVTARATATKITIPGTFTISAKCK